VGRRDLVVVGASAGGVKSLTTLIEGLPDDFPAAVLVVLHVPPTGHSALPTILGRASKLEVKHAEEGDKVEPGVVLVAPPDHHLIAYNDLVTLSRGPRENGHRPAIDVLFRSVAPEHGRRSIGVILSGALDDGTAGLFALRSRGALGVVQDPDEALHASMPRSAIQGASPEFVVPIGLMPELLVRLTGEDVESDPLPPSPLMEMETAMADMDDEAMTSLDNAGTPAPFACPDCGGTLFRLQDGSPIRFRCRVGHAWSGESLLAQQSSALEGALWMALRSLEEKAELSQDLGQKAADQGHRRSAGHFLSQSEDSLHAASLIREMLTRGGSGSARHAGQ
jgi:two-component system chemotaxis response regulator CheB